MASNSDSIGLSSSTTCEEEHTPSTSGSGSLVFQQDEKPDVKGISVTVAGNIQIKKEGKLDGLLKYELTDKQKADIKEAFDTLDYDKTGFIYTKDLKIALRALGFEPRKNDIKILTERIDKKNTGKVSYTDFLSLMTTKLAEKDNREEINKAFKLFDLDQMGKISFQNLQQIATELGETLNDEEIMEMIQEADQDGDGMVSCDEFFRIMKKTSLY